MWITVASILAAFEISPVVDGRGVAEIPKEEFLTGVISQVARISLTGSDDE